MLREVSELLRALDRTRSHSIDSMAHVERFALFLFKRGRPNYEGTLRALVGFRSAIAVLERGRRALLLAHSLPICIVLIRLVDRFVIRAELERS